MAKVPRFVAENVAIVHLLVGWGKEKLTSSAGEIESGIRQRQSGTLTVVVMTGLLERAQSCGLVRGMRRECFEVG